MHVCAFFPLELHATVCQEAAPAAVRGPLNGRTRNRPVQPIPADLCVHPHVLVCALRDPGLPACAAHHAYFSSICLQFGTWINTKQSNTCTKKLRPLQLT